MRAKQKIKKMKFYAVIYDPDGKNKTTWVRESWIYQFDAEMGFCERKYVFYHSDKLTMVPAQNILATIIQTEYKTKEDGFMYPATVLKGFSKLIVS